MQKNIIYDIDTKEDEIDMKLHFRFATIALIVSVLMLNRFSYFVFNVFVVNNISAVMSSHFLDFAIWGSFFFFKFSLLMYSIHHFYLGLRKYIYCSHCKKIKKSYQQNNPKEEF